MKNTEFDLEGSEYIPLNQLLKLVGLCESGGQGKQIVAMGEVYVDGQQELRKTCKIRVGQRVRLDDVLIIVVDGGADPDD